MKPTLLTVCALLAVTPAFAKGKDFQDGLSNEEVTKLTKSLGAMEAKYNDAKPSMEKLKKSPDIRKSAKLTAAASDVLKTYTTIGVFLQAMEQGIKARDPKLNAFEIKLKAEIDQLELKLGALKQQAQAAKASSIVQLVAGAVVLAAALDTLYVTFDGYYDLAVADVDLVIIPAYDVYEVVQYTSPHNVTDEEPVTTWEAAGGEE